MLATVQSTVYAKTSVGGFFFDAYLRIDHVSKVTLTQHPVQTGASITDHSYVEPRELTIQIGMSDVIFGAVSNQFTGDKSRSVAAYKMLRELQNQRVPIEIVTRFDTYENMVVEIIEVPEDFTMQNALKATVTFKEILVVNVGTVKISARPQATGSTNSGKTQSTTPNSSILYQIEKLLLGK